MIDNRIKSLYKTIKAKRKNAIFSGKIQALIYEKKRIRSLEMSNPISDIHNSLSDIGLIEQVKKSNHYKNVMQKSEQEHYLLGRITLDDKKEYYSFLDDILLVFKDIKEREKNKT